MNYLKRSFAIITILAISQVSNAEETYVPIIWVKDCVSDCKDALGKADKLIDSLKEEVDTYKQLTNKQQEAIVATQNQLDEKNQELESLFRNPWFMATLGLVVGGGLVLYLDRK